MNDSICTAVVQMDVRSAPTVDRLYRAECLLQDSVELGAELVLLPELFNTGYTYSLDNFHRAETIDGPTITWMKHSARRLQTHLAGTLLLHEDGECYNAMLLVAPDGRTWRYDKSYPWAWERGYFRESRRSDAQRAEVAHTDLGRLGMLICWDAAHPELWQYYAGQVDMMLISSCPPQITDPTFLLPPDVRLSGNQLGPAWAGQKGEGQRIFGTMIDEQSAWLGVPAAHASTCGQFESQLPNGREVLLSLALTAPGLLRYLPHAGQMKITTPMIENTRIVSAEGKPLAVLQHPGEESFAIADVALAVERQQPVEPQPPSRASRLSYWFSDTLLPKKMRPLYEQGKQRLQSS